MTRRTQTTALIGSETSAPWSSVFDEADEIELVDLPPDALHERLKAGKVYLGEHAVRAAELRLLPPNWWPFVVMGILSNAVPFALIAWSLTRIGSGLAAVLNATTPLFAIVLAHLTTTDDRITPARATGLLLGLAGVAVMIGPGVVVGGIGGHLAGETATSRRTTARRRRPRGRGRRAPAGRCGYAWAVSVCGPG